MICVYCKMRFAARQSPGVIVDCPGCGSPVVARAEVRERRRVFALAERGPRVTMRPVGSGIFPRLSKNSVVEK